MSFRAPQSLAHTTPMRRLVYRLAASWLVFWGLLGCTACGGALLLIANPVMFGQHFLNPGILAAVIAVVAAPAVACLWEGILFFRREAFSLFGEATTLVNAAVWGLLATWLHLGTPIGMSIRSFMTLKLSCAALFVFNLSALSCVWVSRHQPEQREPT